MAAWPIAYQRKTQGASLPIFTFRYAIALQAAEEFTISVFSQLLVVCSMMPTTNSI